MRSLGVHSIDMRACTQCGAESRIDARYCWSCGTAFTPDSPAESRRVVTVLFCDLADSTGLGGAHDPEPVRRVLARYFEAMRSIVERHGGTVEKFIGDAVMAVFGVPEIHEDDALRAVRAAHEMQARVVTLDVDLLRDHGIEIEARIGIATGEVVAGDASLRETMVTGQAVTLAARLEAAAPPGGVLISVATHELVRDAVQTEATPTLELKGKGRTEAWRLVAVSPPEQRSSPRYQTPLVGRGHELRALEAEFGRVVADRRCIAAAVVGEAGVGKSRLAEELLATLAGRARIVRCRCLPYGDGAAFWPVLELVRDAARILATDTPEEARTKVSALVPGPAGERVATLIGLTEAPGTTTDAPWAFGLLLESLAEDGPTAVLIDELHWAEPGFLELLAYVERVVERPVLLLCLARSDLVERRPEWNARTVVRLETLGDADAARLADALGATALARGLRRRILAAAGGNPFFVEQLVAFAAESSDAEEERVPPSIQVVLAARLDGLTAPERRVVERAAVIGQLFGREALAALADPRDVADVDEILAQLDRRGLVRPDETATAGGRAYRFRHILLTEAAYARLTKDVRADLHARFADWLAGAAGRRARELDEVLGYHLERSVRYREELGPLDAGARALSARAAGYLASGGGRALGRGDAASAVRLLERAAALLPKGHEQGPEITWQLGRALIDVGDLGQAADSLEDAVAAARARSDERTEWRAKIDREALRIYLAPDSPVADTRRLCDEAIEVFGRLGDDLGLARAWRLVAFVSAFAAAAGQVQLALENALTHARLAGDRREEAEIEGQLVTALSYGAVPVDEAIGAAEEHLRDARERGSPSVEARILAPLAVLRAMHGDFDGARSLLERARRLIDDLGWATALVNVAWAAGEVELLAGDPAAAEPPLREAYEYLHRMGERSYLPSAAAVLALAEAGLGHDSEALALAAESAAAAAPNDAFSQVLWRAARSLVLARRGESSVATELAQQAVDRAAATDSPVLRAEALLALADVLRQAGQNDRAAEAAREALALAETKGLVPTARRALSSARAPAPARPAAPRR